MTEEGLLEMANPSLSGIGIKCYCFGGYLDALCSFFLQKLWMDSHNGAFKDLKSLPS